MRKMKKLKFGRGRTYELHRTNYKDTKPTPPTPIAEEGEPVVKPGLPKKQVRFNPHLKTVGNAVAVTSGGKARRKARQQSRDHGSASPLSRYARNKRSLSLARAARDGLLDVVQSHLDTEVNIVNDVDEDGYTALHHAARYNRCNVLQCLVDSGADANVRGADDVTPLHVACRYNSDAVVQYLLAQGADISAKDAKGRTPLHYATRRGHDIVTKMLLSVASCHVNVADNDLSTPLHMAAVQGNASICELLISRGATIGVRDINDMTALMWAAAEGHMEVIKLLLKIALKLGPSERTFYVRAYDNEGNTALHLAVLNGKLDVCKILIENSADINSQKFNFATPLHTAATMGFLDIAQLLISHGADVNRADIELMTPIHKAALFNKVEMMKLLISHGADINAKDKKNKSPLHCACWKGQTEAVRFLLDHGAQVAEVDSSLMTPLHWAVQFSHYDTLISLLKHSGKNLLEETDKNDQTVLHYAAHTGNVLILRTLLDQGAKPDAKDQDEQTPLHTAARYDNVNCVEALVEASKHEVNDDDVEGHTPILIASMYGHHQVVQVLHSLGGDLSIRDDEHRTALMLSAAEGHTQVIKILLDNQVSVNEVDKTKNTALHYACSGGYVEAVQSLLGQRADVTMKNNRGQSPICLAIQNLHSDVAIAMLKHSSWRDVMTIRDNDGRSVLDKLIARLPEAALVVLDHCVERTTRDDTDLNLTMVFDYQYIDPGPDDPHSSGKSYLALNTMVEHGRDNLLSHPLCQSCLSQKWSKFGGPIFYFNLSIYIGYLVMLTLYATLVGNSVKEILETGNGIVDDVYGCAINLSKMEQANATIVTHYIMNGQPSENKTIREPGLYVVESFLMLVLVLFAVRELSKLFMQKWKYFINAFNLIAFFLICSTYAFCHPLGHQPCISQWRAGWMALFLAWINFIMYLRRIDTVGIYVIMFVAVLVSLLKAVLVYCFFCLAFAGSFFIIMGNSEPFNTIPKAVVNIIVMTLGEIEYQDTFLNRTEENVFEADASVLLVVFMFLMPVVLMNLMIGIAVGDIDKIQRNAYLKRIALQVGLLYDLENNMPKWLRRKAHLKRAVLKPNEKKTWWIEMKQTLCGAPGGVQFIRTEKHDKTQMLITAFHHEITNQQQRVKSLQLTVQHQTQLLNQIASKLNCDTGGGPGETGSLMQDNMSLYDNFNVHPLTHAPSHRGGSRWGRSRLSSTQR